MTIAFGALLLYQVWYNMMKQKDDEDAKNGMFRSLLNLKKHKEKKKEGGMHKI